MKGHCCSYNLIRHVTRHPPDPVNACGPAVKRARRVDGHVGVILYFIVVKFSRTKSTSTVSSTYSSPVMASPSMGGYRYSFICSSGAPIRFAIASLLIRT